MNLKIYYAVWLGELFIHTHARERIRPIFVAGICPAVVSDRASSFREKRREKQRP